MPLFGTINEGPSVDPELAPGFYEPSGLTGGQALQVPANFANEGGSVEYHLQTFRVRTPPIGEPYLPEPHLNYWNEAAQFPERERRIKVIQLPTTQSPTEPLEFTPPTTTSVGDQAGGFF